MGEMTETRKTLSVIAIVLGVMILAGELYMKKVKAAQSDMPTQGQIRVEGDSPFPQVKPTKPQAQPQAQSDDDEETPEINQDSQTPPQASPQNNRRRPIQQQPQQHRFLQRRGASPQGPQGINPPGMEDGYIQQGGCSPYIQQGSPYMNGCTPYMNPCQPYGYMGCSPW